MLWKAWNENLIDARICQGCPGGSEVKASAWNARDLGSIPGSGRSPAEGNGNPLQYSCLENPMERGAWWATVQGLTKSRTRLSDFISLHFTSLKRTKVKMPRQTLRGKESRWKSLRGSELFRRRIRKPLIDSSTRRLNHKVHKQMDGKIRQTDRRMDAWMGWWMDGWMDIVKEKMISFFVFPDQ